MNVRRIDGERYRNAFLAGTAALERRRQVEARNHPLSPVVVLTDSCCGLPPEILDRYQVHAVPLTISSGGCEYLDKLTLKPGEIYSHLGEAGRTFSTSQPAFGEFAKRYSFLKSCYDSVISVHLSPAPSGTWSVSRKSADPSGLALPEMFTFGISRQLTPKLNVEAGIIYTGWDAYESLTIKFGKPLPGILPTRSHSEKLGQPLEVQAGFECKHSPERTWRLGYTYDQEPMSLSTPDYQVPTGDRQLLSVGFGYSKDNWSLDLAYTYLIAGDRHFETRPHEGIRDSRSHDMGADIFLISFSMRL